MRRPSIALLAVLSLLAGGSTTPSASPGTPAAAPFHVKRTGQGRPVIFIPGLSSSGEVWNESVEHLRGQYDCHVFTLAGFAGQPAISGPFFPTMRQALADYIREQKLEKPLLIGHSLGGVLALAVAGDAPELVGGVLVVDSLPYLPAAMNLGATPETVRPYAEQVRTTMRMQTAEQRLQQARAVLRTFITDEHNVERAMRWSGDSDPETVAQAYYELSTTDLRPELPRITAPTLVLGSWIALKGRVPASRWSRCTAASTRGSPRRASSCTTPPGTSSCWMIRRAFSASWMDSCAPPPPPWPTGSTPPPGVLESEPSENQCGPHAPGSTRPASSADGASSRS